MGKGSSSGCLRVGSRGGHHARSPSKSRLQVRKIPLASFPSNLEDPVKHGRGRKGESRKPAFRGFNRAHCYTRGPSSHPLPTRTTTFAVPLQYAEGADFHFPACRELHRIALAVVSESCPEYNLRIR